jgi:hypothetical protein
VEYDDEKPIDARLRALLATGSAGALEEQTLCALAEAGLLLWWPDHVARVSPASERPPGPLGVGVLDVHLDGQPSLSLRVVVHDELSRGAWRDAADLIVEAAREAMAKLRQPNEEDPRYEDHH